MKTKSNWSKEFDKEFGHLGELWNGKKGSPEGLQVKAFICSHLQQARQEGIEEAIEKIKGMKKKTNHEAVWKAFQSQSDKKPKYGSADIWFMGKVYNKCLEDVMSELKKKEGIWEK